MRSEKPPKTLRAYGVAASGDSAEGEGLSKSLAGRAHKLCGGREGRLGRTRDCTSVLVLFKLNVAHVEDSCDDAQEVLALLLAESDDLEEGCQRNAVIFSFSPYLESALHLGKVLGIIDRLDRGHTALVEVLEVLGLALEETAVEELVKDVEVALTLDLRDNAVLLEEICSAHF